MAEETKNQIVKKDPIDVGQRGIVLSTIEEVYRFSECILKSNLAPTSFKSPEAITVAIQYGFEIGLTPMKALQSIAVVNGRPAIWGDASLALVKASPLCEWVKETLAGNGDAMIATCESKRKGDPDTVMTTFSVEDAKKAGLWGKAGPWSQYPQRMLKYRARGFNLRDAFPDVLGGLHLQEEIADDILNPPTETTPGVKGLKKRIAAKQAEAEAIKPQEQEAHFETTETANDFQWEAELPAEQSASNGTMPPPVDFETPLLGLLEDAANEGYVIFKLKNDGNPYIAKSPEAKKAKESGDMNIIDQAVKFGRGNLPTDAAEALKIVNKLWSERK